ncbi:hypothetical protein NDU88_004305 [Pleurodeles waltl]|uniref:Uncharacterized protein n=1 Tax=Pleurodeles waltl TaxID=8319 RepID=A0AAV7NJE7_PLEWA|nr:hypothetical protein NDU88_004305 [Pleurodeles waltl]
MWHVGSRSKRTSSHGEAEQPITAARTEAQQTAGLFQQRQVSKPKVQDSKAQGAGGARTVKGQSLHEQKMQEDDLGPV